MTGSTPDILSPRLQRLAADLQNRGDAALSEFWDEVERQTTPLIEPGPPDHSLVTFVWRDDGSARHVAVIQDFGTDGIREHHLARLPDSDVWYLTRTMRSDTRTTYQLSPSTAADPNDMGSYQLDPLNPKTFPGFLFEDGQSIPFSLLELPDAPALPWQQVGSTRVDQVQLQTPLADGRRLWVYLPPVRPTTPLPVLVVFDGRPYKDLLKLPDILDYLIDRGEVPPVAALLVDNADRNELTCQPPLADYLTHQVLPWLRATYPITSDPRRTILVGSSLGGLAAVFVAFSHPDTWGVVLSQTGWFRWHPEDDPEHHWLARQLAAAPLFPLRFWLQVGNLEVAQMADGGPSQLAANRSMRDTLQAKGYAVAYQEYSGGHDASSLRFPLAQALKEILNALPDTAE